MAEFDITHTIEIDLRLTPLELRTLFTMFEQQMKILPTPNAMHEHLASVMQGALDSLKRGE